MIPRRHFMGAATLLALPAAHNKTDLEKGGG